MGSPGMDGPDKPFAPYRLRSVMERQEGAVPQVRMRLGEKVTQAELIGTDRLIFFTGTILDAPTCRAGAGPRSPSRWTATWRNSGRIGRTGFIA